MNNSIRLLYRKSFIVGWTDDKNNTLDICTILNTFIHYLHLI